MGSDLASENVNKVEPIGSVTMDNHDRAKQCDLLAKAMLFVEGVADYLNVEDDGTSALWMLHHRLRQLGAEVSRESSFLALNAQLKIAWAAFEGLAVMMAPLDRSDAIAAVRDVFSTAAKDLRDAATELDAKHKPGDKNVRKASVSKPDTGSQVGA
ncbi:hypothetical protein LCGC14_2573880 [marine sediment metagenome]|uniref:Uncharacterized protein n=1 Tax=marine sediment metagenome TaxID=412755 RepID=A0A0F9CSN2_9ZZZZ